MFLGNESKLCDAGLMSFFGGKKKTPISIIRMISWAGMSVHKIFMFFYHALWLLLLVFFWRFDQFYRVFYPDNEKINK